MEEEIYLKKMEAISVHVEKLAEEMIATGDYDHCTLDDVKIYIANDLENYFKQNAKNM